ncbi:MAG: RMD1 family protein [Xanthobacteraceae bacterium]
MTELPTVRDGRITFRALLLGDRIETAGLERSDVLSTLPLAFRAGQKGIVALFRYGVAVMVGMSPLEEDEVIRRLDGRVVGPIEPREEETVQIEIAPERDDQIAPSGAIVVKALTTEHTLLIADALATSVVLAHDEKNVATVFGVIQPIAQQLAQYGRTPGGRRAILKHIGNALLVQHRVSGLVAVAEKPDVLWERPDLERLYARLEDEYELKERADVLTRKLTVISDSAKAFADIIDTERSLRLELIIVVLIAVEIVIAGFQLWAR